MRQRGGAGALLAACGLALHAASRGRSRRVAAHVAGLDPERDARRVQWLLASREFPSDVEQALSFALFRTFAVPSISSVLVATGEFEHRAQKRYDDTELVLAEIARHGLDVPRGRTALRRMNAMHAAFDLDPQDMAYVLSTFVVQPVRWLERWGWRPPTAAERRSFVVWYGELGHHMGLRDLPRTYEGWVALHDGFEADRFRHHPDNEVVADATVQLLLDQRLPAPLHGVGRVLVRAAMEPGLCAALGRSPAPRAAVVAVDLTMRTRAWVLRNLVPERRTPHDLTAVRRPTYPDGHDVEQLGTWPGAAVRAAARRRRAAVERVA